MTARHTPGPWRLHGDSFIETEDELPVAFCYSPYRLEGRLEGGGNIDAALIAAAPDLYRELKSALACIEAAGQCLGNMDAMRAAIAKAEGG